MIDQAAAIRYADAFLNALEKGKKLRAGLEEIKSVAELYSASKELKTFLSSPEIDPEKKRSLLARIWGSSVSPETMGLLQLLLKWDRVDHLPDIAEAAVRLAEARAGIIRGEVITARPISEKETELIAKAVGERLGKKVNLERQVDPALLGGIRVSVGTTLLDGSVKKLLEEVHLELKNIKVSAHEH